MLVHLRLTVPAALTDDVVDLLADDDRSANLTLCRGASISPEGDLVECDVARELAGEVIGRLKAARPARVRRHRRHDSDQHALRRGASPRSDRAR